MKTIIVATDFSEGAENATRYAAAAAAEHQFELVLFTLYNVSVHALNARVSVETLNQMLDHYSRKLEVVAQELRSSFGIEVATRIASGDFHEEISRCITAFNADLVVMGMAAKSLEQDLLGNTTTAAIHLLKFPVIAIPRDAQYQGIKNILFACDITRGVHAHVLENVRAFAKGFGARVEVFHVSKKLSELEGETKENGYSQVLEEGLSDVEFFFRNTVSEGVLTAIEAEIENNGIDLLIMVPYKYGFWSSLVHRSKTRMMASGSKIPLMSIPL